MWYEDQTLSFEQNHHSDSTRCKANAGNFESLWTQAQPWPETWWIMPSGNRMDWNVGRSGCLIYDLIFLDNLCNNSSLWSAARMLTCQTCISWGSLVTLDVQWWWGGRFHLFLLRSNQICLQPDASRNPSKAPAKYGGAGDISRANCCWPGHIVGGAGGAGGALGGADAWHLTRQMSTSCEDQPVIHQV